MAMTDTGTVTTEVRDRVLLIGLNRPDKRNALTPEMMIQLSEAYARFDADQNLRCAVLFGHGRAYSAGFDLTRLRDAVSGGELRYAEEQFDPFGCAGRKLSKPVVKLARRIAAAAPLAVRASLEVSNATLTDGQPR